MERIKVKLTMDYELYLILSERAAKKGITIDQEIEELLKPMVK